MKSICPGPSLLRALKEQSLSWKVALGELIDNSFDAGATQVRICFKSNRVLEVHDNGNGCGDVIAMLTLGEHFHQATTKLGRYGVGLKDAALWLWGTTFISTSKGDKSRKCSVNWEHLTAQDDWDIPDPIEEPHSGPSGTIIVFRGYTRDHGSFDRLVDEIAYTFTPGLLQGRQISFEFPRRKPVVAAPFVCPPLEHVVDDEFTIDGKGVRLHAGVVKEGYENKRPGFAYAHHHRIIETTAMGAGTYSTSRIRGEVWLDNSWTLAKNKDALSDNDEGLTAAIYARCEEMLKQASRQALTLTSTAFSARLSASLREALKNMQANAKAKRKSKENNTGSVEPKDSGKKHRNAKRKQPGTTMPDGMGDIGSLQVEWRDCEEGTLGEVDVKGNRVYLNQLNPCLTTLRDKQNIDALLVVCTGLLADAANASHGKQLIFPRMKADSFMTAWAEFLATIEPAPLVEYANAGE